jgi:hypothetical protein
LFFCKNKKVKTQKIKTYSAQQQRKPSRVLYRFAIRRLLRFCYFWQTDKLLQNYGLPQIFTQKYCIYDSHLKN